MRTGLRKPVHQNLEDVKLASLEETGQISAVSPSFPRARRECALNPTPADMDDDATPALAMPDRLSIDPRSPYHDAAVFERPIGVRLNGQERHDVEEYCVSEQWVKVPAGKARDRKGQPLLIKLKGTVEAYRR